MRSTYLYSLPEHAYVLPAGPTLNFTLADLFVLLPIWFKNIQIAARALNNGVSASVHFEILRKHRALNIPKAEPSRLSNIISDSYRRTMRRSDGRWTKASHRAPEDWDPINMSVNNFVPDAASVSGSRAKLPVPLSLPIPFKDLMKDVTKLPQGPDAGDLTRAVEFAINDQKLSSNGGMSEWMFPTDIHTILNHIGYTTITDDHLDASAVVRYSRLAKESVNADRKRRREMGAAGFPAPATKRKHVSKAKVSGQVAPPQADLSGGAMHQPLSHGTLLQHHALRSSQPQVPTTDGVSSSNGQYGLLPPLGNNVIESALPSHPQEAAQVEESFQSADVPLAVDRDLGSAILPREEPVDGAEEIFSFGMEDVAFHDIDELIAGHQDYDLSNLFTPETDSWLYPESEYNALGTTMQSEYVQYAFDHPLRECVEADDYEDFGDLARAARWCRDPENLALHYTVNDAYFVVNLMDMMKDADRYGSGTA
jgi:hypothetical protein